MKLNFFKFTLLFSIIVLISSCVSTTDTTTLSSNPCFSSLTFAKMDSVPNISTASFTLEYDASLNDSVIVNLDSLPYKTRIDSVYPTFTFISSAGVKLFSSVIYKYKKDSTEVTGKDTVDFRQPVYVRNYAADEKTYKKYLIRVNVHQVQPELYIWSKVNEGINSYNSFNQKAIISNDTILYFLNNGSNSYLYTSTDGSSWGSSPITITGLPANLSFNDMQLFSGKLYVTQDDKIYSSSNHKDWVVKMNPDYIFKSLLFSFTNKLWAVVQSKTDLTYRFATSINGVDWIIKGVIPANFPTHDFTSLTYASRTDKPKVLVLGGYSKDNQPLYNRWGSEDCAQWSDFSIENHSLDTLSVGASVISYDDKLFVFGLRKDNLALFFKQSLDEGLSWQIPNKTYNFLPTNFTARNYQSVVVLKSKTYPAVNSADLKEEILASNRIFIIGGQSTTAIPLSDIWTGKLNRLNFLRQ